MQSQQWRLTMILHSPTSDSSGRERDSRPGLRPTAKDGWWNLAITTDGRIRRSGRCLRTVITVTRGWLTSLLAAAMLAIALPACGSGGSDAASVRRLVDHHCSSAADGAELVDAQIANDGGTGEVQAVAYVLLSDHTFATPDLSLQASPWQYDSSISGHESHWFEGEVPLKPGDQVLGCGVKIGDGAASGVTYLGDGA